MRIFLQNSEDNKPERFNLGNFMVQLRMKNIPPMRQYFNIDRVSGYVIAILLSLAAFLLTTAFTSIVRESRLLFYFSAVVISAWYGGFGPGMVATMLTLVFANLAPEVTLFALFTRPQDLLQLTIFSLIAFMVSYLEEARARSAEQVQAARDQLEIILQGVAEGITAQNALEQMVFANEAAAQTLGFPSAQLMMQSGTASVRGRFQMLHEDGSPISPDDLPVRRVLREAKSVEETMLMVDQETGEARWIIVKSSPVLDDHGKSALVIHILRDITERRAAQEERIKLNTLLEDERQRLQNVIANVPGLIWENHTNDGTNKLVFISEYVEKLLGYTATEAKAEADFWSKVVHPEDLQDIIQQATEVYENGGVGIVTFRAIHKNGDIVNIEAYMTVIMDGDKPIGTRGVMMDVSERHRSEQALQRYAQMLRRSNEELRQFAYVASHDLQEPLRMVTSYLQLIERRYKDKLDSDAFEFIAYAVDGAARMKELINDLLAYSRVERSEKQFEEFDAAAALNKALANLTLSIKDNQAKITHDELPRIFGDQSQIVQLFQNLIGNAIKFHGEQPPEIHIGVTRSNGDWEFSVRDNGIGIEQEYLDRIFIIFQRLHNKSKYPGTGIGLSICKKVVERHGGNIRVESSPGKGTTFYFTIPVKAER